MGQRDEKREWWCRLTLRLLAAAFALGAVVFAVQPDRTVHSLNAAGSWLGHFPPAPASALRLWLTLAIGDMVLVAALAYVAPRDLRRHRARVGVLAGAGAGGFPGSRVEAYRGGIMAMVFPSGQDIHRASRGQKEQPSGSGGVELTAGCEAPTITIDPASRDSRGGPHANDERVDGGQLCRSGTETSYGSRRRRWRPSSCPRTGPWA